MMKVKEVAELVGISVRTLHHYDDIGLLVPDYITETGYRLYSEDNLELLQQILFFKELGFPLKQIKKIINEPQFDRQKALELQRDMLLEKRRKLDQMITTINKTIKHRKGEILMTNEEKFEGFDFSHNPYEQEARERWGDKRIDNSIKKLGKQSTQEKQNLSNEMEAIFCKIAQRRHCQPESEDAQLTISEWYNFLNDNFGEYSPTAFAGLGKLYIEDERFTKNIDKYGEGLARFMCNTMSIFSKKIKY